MSTQTRRERRAAQLAERRSEQRSRATSSSRSGARSPVVLLSVGALLLGAVIVAALFIVGQGQRSGGGTSDLLQPIPIPLSAALIHGRSLGDPEAPVKIEVWSDFQCPACGTFTRTIEPLLRSSYVADGVVELTYRDFAFLGPESLDAAVGARVAEEIGPGFWPFHDLLFENQDGENEGAFDRERLGAMAESLGIDRATFLERLDDPALRDAVGEETASGSAAGIEQHAHADRRWCRVPGQPTMGAAGRAHRTPRRRLVTVGRARSSGASVALVVAAGAALVTSGYLTWTKLAGEDPVCGPLRGCETVSTSPYSEIMGIPVALFGMLAAALMLAGALAWWGRSDRRALYAVYGLGLISLPILAYLAYLEVVVIEAICVWCVAYTVAVVATWAVSLVILRRSSVRA